MQAHDLANELTATPQLKYASVLVQIDGKTYEVTGVESVEVPGYYVAAKLCLVEHHHPAQE